jgi:hypothetical protein
MNASRAERQHQFGVSHKGGKLWPIYASRAERALISAVMAMALLVGSGVAFAQGGPVNLTPPPRPQPPDQTQPQLQTQPQPQVQTQPQPQRSPQTPLKPFVGAEGVNIDGPAMGGVVEQQSLGQVDLDVAGVLNGENGGFGPAMWWGTDRRVIETLMAQLPVTSPSPVMHNLMRRLLLTGAEVPEGGQPGSLISLRAGLLASMGDFQGVNALLGVVPGYSDNAELLRVEMDTRLLTGDVARACQMAHANIETQDTLYWQKAFNFCQALEGQQQAALLGLLLLEELGVDDPVFVQLIRAIANQTKMPVIDSLADPTPLHLALARVAQAQLPSDVISSNRSGVLRAIAISPNANAELRLEAAELAERAGALEVDALRQLYASIEFTDDELKNSLTASAQRSGPMSRALLYRATLSQTVPAAQAEALSRTLSVARTGGRYASAARAFLPQLSRIEATSDLAWFAPEAIRAFLVSGHAKEVEPWFDLLNQAAKRDPEMAVALERLMPVVRLAGFSDADSWTMDRLGEWWSFMKDTPGAREKAAMLIVTFDALGEFVPETVWLELLEGPSHQSIMAPHPSSWFLLDSASAQARIGETVLLSLVILGDFGPARVEPMIVHRVLKALRNIGLNDEARAMALEAVVAAGL